MNSNNLKDVVQMSTCILLDVEGTTTSFDFVKNELFPFARYHLRNYIKQHWRDREVQEAVSDVIKQAAEDQKMNLNGFVPLPSIEEENFQDDLVSNLLWQMSNDCKTTGLKKIQGFIWRKGYKEGLLKGHVYEDTVEALKYWKSKQKMIYIYSSGSIEAQHLLFRYSVCGNLEHFIDGNFDTTIGSKCEPSSYKDISKSLHVQPQNILFITDRPKEIFAAKKSGMNGVLMIRDPNHSLLKEEEKYLGHEDASIATFEEIMEKDRCL